MNQELRNVSAASKVASTKLAGVQVELRASASRLAASQPGKERAHAYGAMARCHAKIQQLYLTLAAEELTR